MLESHTREIDTIDTAAIKRARKKKEKKIKKNNCEDVRRQNRSAALGRPAMKLVGGGGGGGGEVQLVCGRSTLAHSSALVPQTLSCSVRVEDS